MSVQKKISPGSSASAQSRWFNLFLTDAEAVDGERMMSSKRQARTSNPGQKMPPSPTWQTSAWAGTTWCWTSFDRSSYEVTTSFVLTTGETNGPWNTENSNYGCHEAVLLYFICLLVFGQHQLIQNSLWRTGWSTPYSDSLVLPQLFMLWDYSCRPLCFAYLTG